MAQTYARAHFGSNLSLTLETWFTNRRRLLEITGELRCAGRMLNQVTTAVARRDTKAVGDVLASILYFFLFEIPTTLLH